MTNTVGFRPKLLPPGGRQLERSHRPVVTWVTVSGCITLLVSVVFGLTAFNVYSHRFGRTEHQYHVGDEMSLRQASSDLSPTFCSAYVVTPMGWTQFYLLPREAQLDPTKTVHMSFTLTSLPMPEIQSVHYLPVNSTVKLSACYDTDSLTSDPFVLPHDHLPAMFLVIVGDNNYKEWRKHFNPRHVKYTVRIPRNTTCGSLSSVRTLNLTVSRSDNYHFVLMSRTPVTFPQNADGAVSAAFSAHLTTDNATLIFSGSISKTVFNVTGALARCNTSEITCKFPLRWATHPDVVAIVDKDAANPDAAVSFFTRCHERLEFWVPVFGVLPGVIVVLSWLWCWWLLVRKRNLRSRYRVRETAGQGGQGGQMSQHGDYGSRDEREPLVVEIVPQEQEAENEDRCASIQG